MSQAIRLDGKALADHVCQRLALHAAAFAKHRGRPIGLAVILVGDDAASAVYVRNKERRAQSMGLRSKVLRLPGAASQAQVIEAVQQLNADAEIDGFLVQLPLPVGIDAAVVTSHIDPDKDADGLHPLNMGRLMAGVPAPRPCTPAGVMALIASAQLLLAGKRAVVVGRSAIVGKPMAMLLLEAHATVTICHSRSQDLAEEVGRADLVVAAVGKPHLVRGGWIKEGATVIDVGINRVNGKLVGDVAYDEAALRAHAITPVPGGVGPMTIAMLAYNTVQAAYRKAGLPSPLTAPVCP